MIAASVCGGRLAAEGLAAGRELVQDRAERELVASGSRPARPARLLRGHVADRPEHDAGRGLRRGRRPARWARASRTTARRSPEPSARSLARPKSRIFTKPSPVTITFSGLRSRCTMPAACALARPSAIWAPISRSAAHAAAGRPSCHAARAACGPRTSSITMYGRPEVSPISWIVTMLGWLSEEAARASCAKRPSRTASAAKRSGRNFTATSRCRSWSRARHTSPMPPAPSREQQLVAAEPHADRGRHGALASSLSWDDGGETTPAPVAGQGERKRRNAATAARSGVERFDRLAVALEDHPALELQRRRELARLDASARAAGARSS